MDPTTDFADDFDSQASSSMSSSRASSQSSVDEVQRYYRSRSTTPDRAANDNQVHLSSEAGQAPVAAPAPETPVVSFSMRRHGPPVIGQSIHVTPYIMYQLARSFGFPKRVLVFPRANEVPGTFYAESRGLLQFDEPSDAVAFIDAVAAAGQPLDGHRAILEVQFSDDCPDVFTMVVSHAAENKVFVTKNTNFSLVITPQIMQKIGPLFETAPLQSQRSSVTSVKPHPPPCL